MKNVYLLIVILVISILFFNFYLYLALKKFKFVGEAPGIILLNKKGLKSFSKNLNEFLKKNYLLNWEKAINFHCIKNKIYYHFTKSVKWIEIDTKLDFKKAKIIFKSNYQK